MYIVYLTKKHCFSANNLCLFNKNKYVSAQKMSQNIFRNILEMAKMINLSLSL